MAQISQNRPVLFRLRSYDAISESLHFPFTLYRHQCSWPLGNLDRIMFSPSVAKANFLNLGAGLNEAVAGGAEWLHFFARDGRMMPKISFGAPVVPACREAVFDVKLGCIELEARVDDFINVGADVLSPSSDTSTGCGHQQDRRCWCRLWCCFKPCYKCEFC